HAAPALLWEVVPHVRLISLHVSVFYTPVEALYSYWVFHLCVSPLYDSSLNERPVARLICQYSERREQRENKNAFLVLALPSRILYILMQIYAILFEYRHYKACEKQKIMAVCELSYKRQ
ncbi:hypothetical protein, partial [Xylanibacter rarus]|uniref:hypothetical protein n=1 Tax=Xylanibacter rarus TaxID=1676614 RepID=UPI003FEF8A6E